MRAWRVHELGEPSAQMTLDDIDEPEAKPGNVVLEVGAVGLSFPDVLQCRGEYQVKPKLPFIPGGETAGVVTAVGEGVEGIEIGQRVLTLGGGLAERVSVGAGVVFPMPDALSMAKGAAIPVNYGTTWFALHDRGQLKAGETILITGAAGGTGSAAIQLAKAAGATVIAIAGGATKAQACANLGADVVIDHHETPDFVDAVREATKGVGVDVCYDPVGGDVFQKARRCMAWDGRYLIIGFTAGIADAPTNHVLLKNYSIVGVHWGASLARDFASVHRQMEGVLALTATGEVNPLLYEPYAFDDAATALQDLADRKTHGKVVVEV